MDLDKFRCTRDKFADALRAENIECMVYYPSPLTKQPALEKYSEKMHCPVAEDIAKRVFSIPVHPNLTKEDLEKILEALEKVSTHYLK